MSRRDNSSTIRIIVVFLIIIAAFWVLIVNFLPQNEPELVYLNETDITKIIDEEPWTVKLGTYSQIPLEVEKGDVLNITIKVVNGGPIDFFVLEVERAEMLINALEGRNNRFESYDRGKGLNITYANTEFIIVNNDNWVLFLNNYGHVQDGARPTSSVVVMVDIEKIGYH